MSLIPSNYHKPDLFLIRDNPDNNNVIDVTNCKIDDLVNLFNNRQGTLVIMCFYESSNLNPIVVSKIEFSITSSDRIRFLVYPILSNDMNIIESSYNNKLYYAYYQQEA